ncbi:MULTISPECIES: ubiquinone biosynthesis regulatory protein kinase UbiB [Pseudomonas]|uniref:Probable protein kinase UbiB n=1 Tax=Pseudomonas spirodelae TaxID=3101751 RepID=A0ABU5PBQ9_9PSED|nr:MULTISPECIES: ubiquinone biosynthesis regulatory protein kinase UbiB [unclassified Pseudomonas]MBU0807425.1 ubiquinone biosynthesis regulatory protein kinase UbiB [Gammaproteobacteria bacterium]MBU0884398.1 ubiquinone biosynthesis regulatory protein kinase UbiB [Gammaproteobacteria bacterium]MBU0901956.1 ubiquinone biosynthesis regulatory protein kinase UbiB [Gammaproteobacteria bacterium]MBU1858658.1 ubiquinone biosynthesis regulatory protein kinase UbiB [Gammaproteobacteria bacterium]MDD2
MKLLAVRRLLRIQRVIIRYQLDDLLFALPLPLWLRALRFALPWRWLPRRTLNLSRGARLRLALEELGPIFIKFGQVLSTRRDLLPLDIADELAKLQDQVPPFDPAQSQALIEAQLGAKVSEVFARFDAQPLASASVAQVHGAQLKSGEEVVVKVIRPGLEPVIEQDIAWLFLLAKIAEKSSADARRLRPVEVVSDYEKTIYDELDLLREAANASQLRRNFEGSPLLYVPQVYWDLCRPKVLVMERIYGIQVTDLATLADQRTDMKLLAERGVEIFFTQVFRDSFFHADMHPGNIFVSTRTPWNPQYIAIDCGIIGSLTAEDQDYLARNLLAFFKRDYRRVAQLHIDSGWVPAETKVNDFEAAIRTVCEPIFERPLKDISFAQLLLRLFQTARRFNMEVQPQLVLLQKTLLNIEGLGRQLYPDLDLWSTAQPFLERWMRERISPLHLLRNLQLQAEQVPHLSQIARETLERLNQQPAQRQEQPATTQHWLGRLLGAALIAGAVSQGLALTLLVWPSWVMAVAGVYLVLRR